MKPLPIYASHQQWVWVPCVSTLSPNTEYCQSVKAGVPNLWDLMPDDLRWRWCNNNRNKVHNKFNVFESSTTVPPHPPSASGKVFFQGTGPWCQKCWGPLCLKLPSLTWKSVSYLNLLFSHLPQKSLNTLLSMCWSQRIQLWANQLLSALVPRAVLWWWYIFVWILDECVTMSCDPIRAKKKV